MVFLCHSTSYPHTARYTDHCSTQITELKMYIEMSHDTAQIHNIHRKEKRRKKILENPHQLILIIIVLFSQNASGMT